MQHNPCFNLFILHNNSFDNHMRAKSKTRAMTGRCKFIECVVGRKFLQKTVSGNVQKCCL